MKLQILPFLLACPVIALAQNFCYPVPPDSIRDRQNRITYITTNFWNRQILSDTANFQTPKLLLDYLYLLKQLNEKNQDTYTKSFISLASKHRQVFGLILYWLDQILYDSSSPYYDEKIYMRLMGEVETSDADSVMKLIPAERVKIMRKNQVGMPANDFSFIDKDEKSYNLYDIESPLLLLIFNNPECLLCHHTEKAINENNIIQNLIKNSKIKVLSITPDADIKKWKKHKYPQKWSVGFDKNSIIYQERLYDIQRLPCIYVLDKEKRVLLKEANYTKLSIFLEEYCIPSMNDGNH